MKLETCKTFLVLTFRHIVSINSSNKILHAYHQNYQKLQIDFVLLQTGTLFQLFKSMVLLHLSSKSTSARSKKREQLSRQVIKSLYWWLVSLETNFQIHHINAVFGRIIAPCWMHINFMESCLLVTYGNNCTRRRATRTVSHATSRGRHARALYSLSDLVYQNTFAPFLS